MSTLKICLVVMVGVVALARAAPLDTNEAPVPIVIQTQNGPNPDGSYSYSYQTGNDIKVEESGSLVASKDSEEPSVAVKGSYSYLDTDGTLKEVSYTADENGFRPVGAHLPTTPATPAAILKALEWILLHPEEDNL